MSEPWIGPHYAETRLLLLGESAYSWEEDGTMRHPSDRHSIDMVEWATGDFLNAGGFMTMLSRAITGTYSPSTAQLRHAWDRVAFTNYVTGSVGVGARVRPSNDMWYKAQQRFLDDTLPRLSPRRIVVLGRTLWGWMPESTSLFLTDDVQGYTNADGSVAICWAVNHPAGGLSWGKLAEIVQFACGSELRLPVEKGL